jgi:hypothetical protein
MRVIAARGNRLGRLNTSPAPQMARIRTTFQVAKRSIGARSLLAEQLRHQAGLGAASAAAGSGLPSTSIVLRAIRTRMSLAISAQQLVVLDLDHGAESGSGGKARARSGRSRPSSACRRGMGERISIAFLVEIKRLVGRP